MQHLVVVAHPSEQSFTMSLARAYIAELDELGHRRELHDLYRMDFDPVFKAHELALANGRPDADVAAEQDCIRAAGALTVIYPLWWLTMPAIMKGYIDRVFARGFAYDSSHGTVHGLLNNKKCILITVSGAPLPPLVGSGNWNAVQALQDTHVFRSAGFDVLEHVHFDRIEPGLSQNVFDSHITRIRDCVHKHFSAI